MAHTTHHTDAIVLRALPRMEGSAACVLLTQSFGMVTAFARSLREERSKLRYSLQPFALTEVSMVRGKEGWRITGARTRDQYFVNARGVSVRRTLLRRIAGMVERLAPGEENGGALFARVREGFELIAGPAPLPDELLPGVEVIVLLRILQALGYLPGGYEKYTEAPILTALLAREALGERKLLVAAVNEAIAASHL